MASTNPVCCANRCIAPIPPLASPRTRSLCSYWMLRARYIGVGCAFQVLGRSRRAIRRLRRASFSCLLVFTRNVLRVSAAFWCRSRTLLCATDISSVSFTRRAENALVLGLVFASLLGRPLCAEKEQRHAGVANHE